jgi:hypothetical protein
VVQFYQFLGQAPEPLGRLCLKSGAIDSLMPQKTHVGLGFSGRCTLGKRPRTKYGEAYMATNHRAFPIARSCQVFEPWKTSQSPVPESLQQLRVEN